jgi:anti-sigma B factor antagonist
MFLLVRHIDFGSRALHLEIVGYSKTRDAELRAYLDSCVKVHYSRFHISHPATLAKRELSRLRTLTSEFDVALSVTEKNGSRERRNPSTTVLKLRSVTSTADSLCELTFIEYTLRGLAAEPLLQNLKDFALLVGLSISLERRLISRLRLGIYELAVNSIEHGTFLSSHPQLEICIGITPNLVEVMFKDNATSFPTANRAEVSIEEHINAGRKRGLGLSLVGKLSTSLRFERILNWNCTTFTLNRQDLKPRKKGRKSMKDFSVELVPYSAKDTLVLRLSGSLDSVSASFLESHLNDAIESGQCRIVVDLSKIDFVSSTGLGLLLSTVTALRADGGDMILMKTPQNIIDTFELMSVDDYFETIESLDELNVPG